ncbi:MAG: PDZ domain-containing protein [Deltaproteobacteria bacterium]|nr:PDZ domain-containing protein [Deltaproteobacteria bacterium]
MKKKIWLALTCLLVALFFLARKAPETSAQIPLVDIPIIGKTLHYIEKSYFDPTAIDPKKLFEEAARELEGSISPFLVKIEEKKIHLRYADKTADISVPSPFTLSDLIPIFRQTLGFLKVNYEGRLDEKEREYLTAAGMMDALDTHSNFLHPKVYQEFKIGTRGTFGGLGIVIGLREGHLAVISPLEETPAWKAGIRAKDRIIQIDEEATINMSLTEAVEKLRGAVGSQVTILIQRDGTPTPLRFTLTRAKIEIRSVAGRLLEDQKIGLVKIKHFQEDTADKFDGLFKKFQKQSPSLEGLILDLRNNPGGLLDQAIEMADRFLAEGVIVKAVGRRSLDLEKAKPGSPLESIPLVVLVNEGSASASEIVAGTFQQTKRAQVLGTLTFGKGTVQTVYDLRDGSALKLTIAKYLTAGDREVQSIGVQPNIELLPVTVQKETVNLYEDERRDSDDEKEKRLPAPQAEFRLQYLASDPKKSEDEESYQIGLEEDFPIQLAKKMLQSPAEPISKLIETTAGEEKKRIEESLTKIGIDWSKGPKGGSPKPVVTVTLTDTQGNPLKVIPPSTSAVLKMEVENQGTGDLYQFASVSKSDDPLFDNIEFPFGHLKPGEKRSWNTQIKTSDNAIPRSEPVQFNFREAYRRLPAPVTLDFLIQEIPLPFFAYSYSIHDGGEKGTSGNQNGVPERGETIGLKIMVKNEGPGESAEPVVNLKNLNGPEIFIKKGREELPKMGLGNQAPVLLLFRIADKMPEDHEKVSFELSIRDKKRDQELIDRIELPTKPNSSVSSAPGPWHESPRISLNLPPLKTNQSQLTLKGNVSDDESVRHIFIFVGRNKVAYFSQKDHPPSLAFETKVKLKEGANLVTVAAQDDHERTTRKQWIVWKGKP